MVIKDEDGDDLDNDDVVMRQPKPTNDEHNINEAQSTIHDDAIQSGDDNNQPPTPATNDSNIDADTPLETPSIHGPVSTNTTASDAATLSRDHHAVVRIQTQ